MDGGFNRLVASNDLNFQNKYSKIIRFNFQEIDGSKAQPVRAALHFPA